MSPIWRAISGAGALNASLGCVPDRHATGDRSDDGGRRRRGGRGCGREAEPAPQQDHPEDQAERESVAGLGDVGALATDHVPVAVKADGGGLLDGELVVEASVAPSRTKGRAASDVGATT